MKAENLTDSAIAAFRHSYFELLSGNSGLISESSIKPPSSIPSLDADIKGKVLPSPILLQQTVVLKLNGGLGTSMGLDKAKSLLEVKSGNTFLDLTAKQIVTMRKNFHAPVRFMLMNSFNTSRDTLAFLRKYPSIVEDEGLELMQNKVPKVSKVTLAPADWAANRHLEWCPPGHGDLYTGDPFHPLIHLFILLLSSVPLFVASAVWIRETSGAGGGWSVTSPPQCSFPSPLCWC
jgi:UDP-N-acetylglucosamine pyrophosphorylase